MAAQRSRMPLSGIYGLAAVYEGLDNDMRPQYASVESSEHYRKIMNDRAFFLSVYSYTRPLPAGGIISPASMPTAVWCTI